MSPSLFGRRCREPFLIWQELSRALWRAAVAKGDLYEGMYTGWYNVREETFVTETDAAAANFLDTVSGKPLKKMEEPSYFFKLSKCVARPVGGVFPPPSSRPKR